MLNKQKIKQMIKEMGMDRLSNKTRFADFDNWTKLSSSQNPPTSQTYFIEIASTTTAEVDQRGENGKLGGNPK